MKDDQVKTELRVVDKRRDYSQPFEPTDEPERIPVEEPPPSVPAEKLQFDAANEPLDVEALAYVYHVGYKTVVPMPNAIRVVNYGGVRVKLERPMTYESVYIETLIRITEAERQAMTPFLPPQELARLEIRMDSVDYLGRLEWDERAADDAYVQARQLKQAGLKVTAEY